MSTRSVRLPFMRLTLSMSPRAKVRSGATPISLLAAGSPANAPTAHRDSRIAATPTMRCMEFEVVRFKQSPRQESPEERNGHEAEAEQRREPGIKKRKERTRPDRVDLGEMTDLSRTGDAGQDRPV